jgi:carnosine N-methyltransferase
MLCEAPFELPKVFDAVDEAMDSNAELAEAIVKFGLPAFGIQPGDESWHGYATPNDIDKARSTLRQFFRDWSAEGQQERQTSYLPIFKALDSHLYVSPVPLCLRHHYNILLPGAGLGRLLMDLCVNGYTVEGNEISYHQLLASNYILNYTSKAGQHRLYPWALNFSNHLSRRNQLQGVAVPDIHPGTELELSSRRTQSDVSCTDRLSMAAGDFCEVYRRPEYAGAFSAVVTCFFIGMATSCFTFKNLQMLTPVKTQRQI